MSRATFLSIGALVLLACGGASAVEGPPQPPTPPSTDPPSPAPLFADYSRAAPHYRHVRTAVTEWRIGYLPAAQRAAEYDWVTAHYDHFLGGAIDQVKSRVPTATQIEYVVVLTVIQPGQEPPALPSAYYDDMVAWYRLRPEYQLEDAFLHRAGGGKTLDNRLANTVWGNRRWYINVGDPGARAYTLDRLRRVLRQVPAWERDGIFIDEHDHASMSNAFKNLATNQPQQVLEYGGPGALQPQVVGMLQALRAGLGAGKILQVNTAEYTQGWSQEYAVAAGAALLELVNNPMRAMVDRWKDVDAMLQQGVTVQLVTALTNAEYDGMAATFPRGNETSPARRGRLFELASYYMVLTTPDRTWLTTHNGDWLKQDYATNWIKAIEANIGTPTAARSVLASGTDGAGQRYDVWQRPFTRALVLCRPQYAWNTTRYGDDTAMPVTLPAGESWYPLRADGTLGAAVASVTLRAAEAMILVKGSALK